VNLTPQQKKEILDLKEKKYGIKKISGITGVPMAWIKDICNTFKPHEFDYLKKGKKND